MRKSLFLLAIPAMVVAVLILLLQSRGTPGQGGFRRRLLPGGLTLTATLPNRYSALAVAGYDQDRLFFSTRTPGELLVTDNLLRQPAIFRFPLAPDRKLASRFSTVVTDGRLWLFAGNVPAIYRYTTGPLKPDRKILLPAIFTSASPARGGLLLRLLENNRRGADAVFAFYDPATRALRYERGISEKHGDLGFSTDGMLRYDTATGLAVYVEFYRNNLLCIDSALRLRYRSHTIDTISTNRATYGQFKQSFTNSSPKLPVNADAAAGDGRLFVRSAIAASHDPVTGSPLDTYSVTDGRYLGSFNLPFDEGQAPLRIFVAGSRLVAVYPAHIITYLLSK